MRIQNVPIQVERTVKKASVRVCLARHHATPARVSRGYEPKTSKQETDKIYFIFY